MKFELVLLSAAFFSAATGQDDWGYGTTDGPSTWPARYPQCGGKRQSPIALSTSRWSGEAPFDWCESFFNEPNSMTLTNTGHGVSLEGVWDVPPCIWLDGHKYKFYKIHWHWSSGHTINGVRFALEMQMMFTTQGNTSQNIVTLAHMYTESGSSAETPGLAEVVDNIQYVRDADTSRDIKPFPISELLTELLEPVFMYNGSMPIPPCNETVVWIVEGGAPSGVTSSQLSTFRTLRDKKGNTLQKNYRPLQPLNGRTVSYYLSH